MFFKKYFFFQKFLFYFFNKNYKIFLKIFRSYKPVFWCLFSFGDERYYVPTRLHTNISNSFFLNNSYLLFKKTNYINNTIIFKKQSASFRSLNFYEEYIKYEYVNSGKRFFENGKLKTHAHLLSTKIGKNSSILSKRIFAKSNFSMNFFKFKTKALITFNRKMLIRFFNFKIKRQNRITKYINSFIKFKVKNSLKFFNFTLINILVSSKLVINFKQAFFFVKKGFVFVNGRQCLKTNFFLKKGDLIQLNFSKTYITHYSLYFNFLVRLNSRFRNKFFKKIIKRFNIKLGKNQIFLFKNIIFFKKHIPTYFEVDFLTFSVYIIYTPFNFTFIDDKSNYLYNFYLNRLYNWKFLT